MSPVACAVFSTISCAAVMSRRPPTVVSLDNTEPAVATIATLPPACVVSALTWPTSDCSRTSPKATVLPASMLPLVDTSVTSPSLLSTAVVVMLPVAVSVALSVAVMCPTTTSPLTANSALPPALASRWRTRISSGLPLPMSPPASIVTPAAGAVSATMSRLVSPPSRTLPPALIRTALAVPLPVEIPVMVASVSVSMCTVPTSPRKVAPSAMLSSPADSVRSDAVERTEAVLAIASVSAALKSTAPAACTAP